MSDEAEDRLYFDLAGRDTVSRYRSEMEREPSPEEWPAIRTRQLEFLKTFGRFDDSKIFNGLWVGSSPDGRYIGFYCKRDDGTEIRIAYRTEVMLAMVKNISIATHISAERAKAAFQTAGQA